MEHLFLNIMTLQYVFTVTSIEGRNDVWWWLLFRWSIYTYETSVVGSRQLPAAVS